MIEVVDGLPTAVEQLSQRVRELERRVAALEGDAVSSGAAEMMAQTANEVVDQARVTEAGSAALPSVWEGKTPPVTWKGFPALESPAGVFTVVGKAVLGMAGAFLLRALAESAAVPWLAVVTVAIAYAVVWMVLAERSAARNRFASATYAVTSALILAPMLWELTVRFQTLSPAVTAAVLTGYMVLTLALAARHDLELAPWAATIAVCVTSIGLIVATHALVPLTLALLAVGLASEVSACAGRRRSQRVLAALAADFAVWQTIDVMALSKSVPDGYEAASATTVSALCLALLAIYGGSIGVRAFILRKEITYFETGQAATAFVLATYGALRATHGAIAPVLGGLFLSLAFGCYWGALSLFVEDDKQRNRRVSATWAAALLVSGSWLVLPTSLQVAFLCAASVVAAYLYARTGKFSLGLHASVYLMAATAVSPILGYTANTLAGTGTGAPPWSVWLAAFASAACYVVGGRRVEEQTKRRVLWMFPALMVGFTVTALAVSAIVGIAGAGLTSSAASLSMVRTIVVCAVAVATAFLGSLWKRVELGWVAYAAVGLGTLKLFLEDLRLGNATSLVVSLLFYGMVLIVLPKMMQREPREV
jgi:hypothetical protein